MKIAHILAASLALSLVPTQAAILITEVYPGGSGNGTYGADWFEITNTGTLALDITGWKVDDSSGTGGSAAAALALTGITSIGAGSSVIFLEGNAAAVDLFKTAWFGSNVPAGLQIGTYSGSGIGLSTTSDAVNIFNAANELVASVTFNATTTGLTFDNAAGLTGGATISQLSAVGVNGAFTSFNGAEIGSPGLITAVPEPATTAIGFAAVTALFVLFRRRKSARA